MNIRALRPEDLPRIRELHDLYFSDKFEFPDLTRNYFCAFVVEDEKGIITAGGVRKTPEITLTTDLSRSSITKARALEKIKDASKYIALQAGYNTLFVVITEDSAWEGYLKRRGFIVKGTILGLEI